jgi:hypothetical protein
LENTSNDETLKSNKEIVESACKLLIQQVLKKCPTINLSSITIKTTASPVATAKSSSSSSTPKSSNSNNNNVSISEILSTQNDVISTSSNNSLTTTTTVAAAAAAEITKTSTIQVKSLTNENEERKFINSNISNQRTEKPGNLDKKQNSVTNLLNATSHLLSRPNISLGREFLLVYLK